ncbi:oligosaccharide flippase family protein [Microbacterium sp. zg-YB36]|uniref:oligosaccharide flippase family protein n=1 Tax=Microbacterium sp. zg-YB36 TaxID=2969407 RepID=UPI00214B8400|nr:oligosaccharide flippase family protein [Microbacterium sp. zg-YB36]MDL5352363.1 oligosaccharide flippase family protein [Microbacterium sp. zg-YB36]
MSETTKPHRATLRAQATRAAAWSGLSTIVLRLSGLVVGIVLARLLAPEQFGVFAIALAVQGVLMAVADLGLSAQLIRADEPDRFAPTVATLGLVSGGALAFICILGSGVLADLLGGPDAAPAIAVLGVTLLLGGLGVVPYAMLLRRFQQRELFVIAVADFLVSTVVTLGLVVAGFGVMGLAIGRVSAQVVATTLQFALARVAPRFAWDRRVLRPVLVFSLPIAAANLLSWVLINVDNIVLARVAGVVALGYYVLAFNISSWPMTALAQVVRAISLPYFARASNGPGALESVTAIAWAGALPAGALLAVLSAPLIEVLYGARWLPAAPVLAALGVYGSLRVVFDVFAGYLYARGRSRPVLWIQIISLVVLVAAMLYATSAYGIVGAGWAHVAVAVLVIFPAYIVVLLRSGISVGGILRGAWWPTVAVLPAVAGAIAAVLLIDDALVALLVGGAWASIAYVVLMLPWLRRRLALVRPERSVPSGELMK